MNNSIVTKPSPSVSEAIQTRRSVRDFLPDPVSEETVREILSIASRAASGGNLQPWKVYVLAGEARDELVRRVSERMAEKPFGDGPEYAIYPPDLTDPYKARRSRIAHMMYDLVDIERSDREARVRQMNKNFEFFGAPVGMFITVDRQMGQPQFSDLGIFLENIMLLARERGLHTCPQEAWSMWGGTIREVVGVPEGELVFCGVSLGYADPDSAINQLYSERAGVEEFAVLKGF